MNARPAGLFPIFIPLSCRLQFRLKVRVKPILTSVGTQRIATKGNARVNVGGPDVALSGNFSDFPNPSIFVFFF